MTVANELVEWAFSLRLEDVDPSARQTVTHHLVDGLGTAIAAARTGSARPAVQVARTLGGPPRSTILDREGTRVSAPAAALANGTLVHALDYDDTHPGALVHPTAVVLPTILAVGESEGATGRDLLEAAIVGYEVAIRLGAAVRHGFHGRGFHATSVCGVFASALIGARLRGLDRAQAVAALGIAGSQASGSLEFLNTGSDTKQLHPGLASHAGILAMELASAGASGPDSIFEGRAGLYALYATDQPDPASLTDGLGEQWLLTATTLKPYAACQLSHASLDALESVRGDLRPDDVERLVFDVPEESVDIVCEPAATKVAPRTPYEAKFSLQWTAAMLLLDGRLSVESFSDQELARAEVRQLAERVEVRPTPTDVPAADAPGHVEVHLDDGRVVTGKVESSRGSAANPLSTREILDKFVTNCGGAPGAQDVADLVLRLETLPDPSPVLAQTLAILQESS